MLLRTSVRVRCTQVVLLLSLLICSNAWDSRNISAAEWVCSSAGTLSVRFPSTSVACGTEVLWAGTAVMPTIALPSADPASLYTVIIVDRDASSPWAPVNSPLRHMTLASIPGGALAAGISSASAAGAALFPYSGPRPPPMSSCHRYYAMAYEQTPGVVPSIANVSDRLRWVFPQWARNESLSKVAVNVWRTQSADSRTGDCDAFTMSPTPSPSPSPPA